MALAQRGPRPVETPEVTKRRVRSVLKSAREQAGMTQIAVATALRVSTSKVIRLEQGVVPVSPKDAKTLMELYGRPDLVDEMVELAVQAKRDHPLSEFKDSVSVTELSYYGNEISASVIYKYEPTFVPGLFQVPEYVEALLSGMGLSKDEILQKLELRSYRTQLLDQDVFPDMRYIIGEAVLCRPVGGSEVMAAQFANLKELARRPGISLQILPFSVGAHRAMGEAFTIMTFDSEDVPDLLYLQDAAQESTERDAPKPIRRYLDIFNELSAAASAPEDFGAVLDEIVTARLGAEFLTD